jgi:hypothetical protein
MLAQFLPGEVNNGCLIAFDCEDVHVCCCPKAVHRVPGLGLTYRTDPVNRLLEEDVFRGSRPDGRTAHLSAFAYQKVSLIQVAADPIARIERHGRKVGEIEPVPLDIGILHVRILLWARCRRGAQHFAQLRRVVCAKPRATPVARNSVQPRDLRVLAWRRTGGEAAAHCGEDLSVDLLAEEVDHAALLGDEGVDAGGLGVEVVGNRPLLRHSLTRSPRRGVLGSRLPAA